MKPCTQLRRMYTTFSGTRPAGTTRSIVLERVVYSAFTATYFPSPPASSKRGAYVPVRFQLSTLSKVRVTFFPSAESFAATNTGASHLRSFRP